MHRIVRVLFLIPFLFLPAIAKADPIPALTIVGGTMTGGLTTTLPQGLIVIQGLGFNLIGVDPLTGNTFDVGAASEGGFIGTPFFALPGQNVTFVSGIAGTADLGAAGVEVHFTGFGGPIPIGVQDSFDLQGFGSATIQGTFFASKTDLFSGKPPIFTVPFQTISGPVTLHFISEGPGDPRFVLKTATLTVSEVPEPASVVLLVTSLAGLGLWRRRGTH